VGGRLERDKPEGMVKNMGGKEVRARYTRRKGKEYRRKQILADEEDGGGENSNDNRKNMFFLTILFPWENRGGRGGGSE
jgi:hypothetical protein